MIARSCQCCGYVRAAVFNAPCQWWLCRACHDRWQWRWLATTDAERQVRQSIRPVVHYRHYSW